MSRNLFLVRFLRSAAVIAFVVLLAQQGRASQATNPLTMFKRYFGTIDVASNGKGMKGTGQVDSPAPGYPGTGQSFATATIKVSVPPNVEIVAAFFYWLSLEKTVKPTSAVGYLLDPNLVDKAPLDAPTTIPPLQAPPNPNPASNASTPTLQYPVKFFGKPLGNDHAAPCWSNGSSTGSSNGAPTLRAYRADVLRYLKFDPTTQHRVPIVTVMLSDSGSNGGTSPLVEGASLLVVYRDQSSSYRSVVFYDGSVTLNNDTDAIVQTISGFEQASASPNARLGFVLGDGQKFPERVRIGRDVNNLTMLINSPFSGTDGNSWDDLSYNLTSTEVPENAGSVTVKIDHDSGVYDCLSFGSMYYSGIVKDADEDGLLDIWETPVSQGGGFRDPATGNVKIDLYAMGARSNHKDLFVESDYMQEFTTKALDPLKESDPKAPRSIKHSHSLLLNTVDLVGNAFKNAPVPNPDDVNGIKIHFDLGNYTGTDPFIIPGSLGTEGGDVVDERLPEVYCTSYSAARCQFPFQPGLMAWKKTLEGIKHAYVNPACSSNCRTYSSDYRAFVFHYLFLGHGLAVQDHLPPGPFSALSVGGHGDVSGGDVAVTLGLWNFSPPYVQVGDPIMLASVITHELAHNLGGYHGGTRDGMNCNPNNQSVLNYLYIRGLPTENGALAIDLSRQVVNATSEAERTLNEFSGLQDLSNSNLVTLPYRLRWYAPAANVAKKVGIDPTFLSIAKRHCGSTVLVDNTDKLVRVDGTNVKRYPVDWNYSGTTETVDQDINFNGKKDETVDFTLPTDNRYNGDWNFINHNHGLQQLALRRNLWGLSPGVKANELLQPGDDFDLGDFDLGDFDLGDFDLGDFDLGDFDLGDFDLGDFDLGDAEPDYKSTSSDEPSGLTGTPSRAGIDLVWQAPLTDKTITQYTIYRALGTELVAPLTIFTITGAPPNTFFTDTTVQKKTYTYSVAAGFSDGTFGVSTTFTILNK